LLLYVFRSDGIAKAPRFKLHEWDEQQDKPLKTEEVSWLSSQRESSQQDKICELQSMRRL